MTIKLLTFKASLCSLFTHRTGSCIQALDSEVSLHRQFSLSNTVSQTTSAVLSTKVATFVFLVNQFDIARETFMSNVICDVGD